MKQLPANTWPVVRAVGVMVAWVLTGAAGCPPEDGSSSDAIELQDTTFAIEVDALPPLSQGATGTLTVRVLDSDGEGQEDVPAFKDFVELSFVGLPPDMTATIRTNLLTAGQSTAVELRVADDAVPGVHDVWLLATSTRDGARPQQRLQRWVVGGDCFDALPRARSIAATVNRSAAVLEDGRVVVWGFNEFYKRFDRDLSSVTEFDPQGLPNVRLWSAPREVSELAGTARVEPAGGQFAAYFPDGSHAVLGPYYESPHSHYDGTTHGWSMSSAPTTRLVSQIARARSDSVHFYAIVDGFVEYWYEYGGSLEHMDYEQGAMRAARISRNGGGFLVVGMDGRVYREPVGSRVFEEAVPGLAGVTAVATGFYSADLALVADGTVYAWGDNTYGQLGDGQIGSRRATPLQVLGLDHVVAIAAGDRFALALREDGTVWAWGSNAAAELGQGLLGNELPQSAVPLQVLGLTDVVAISAGSEHALALRADGTVWAWGSNVDGQLGDGSAVLTLDPDPHKRAHVRALPVVGIGGAGLQRCAQAQGPVARMTIQPTEPTVGQVVQLDARQSSGGPAGIASYEWQISMSFDNWQTESVEAVLLGPTPSFTFNAPGERRVRLRVTNNVGLGDDAVELVTVSRTAPNEVEFFDGNFGRNDWSVTAVRSGASAEYGSSQVARGGVPADGPYRAVTIDLYHEGPPATPDGIATYHWKAGAVHDPGTRGAIESIGFEIDASILDTLPGTNQLETTLVLRQGSRIFRVWGLPPALDQWGHLRWAGLSAYDFVESRGVVDADRDSHPDFSSAGSPIEFGFSFSVYRPVGGPDGHFEAAFDNWSVTIATH